MADEKQPEMTPEEMKAFEKRMDSLMFKAKEAVSDFLNNTENVTTFDVVQFAILFNIYIGKVITEQEFRPERPIRVKEAMMSVFSQAFSALDVLAETNPELGPEYVPARFANVEVADDTEDESDEA